MRKLDAIVIHYTATQPGRVVSLAEIDGWHRARGWAGIGYHFLISLDGVIERGRPVGKIGAHVGGHNTGTIGIAYVGGLVAPNVGADTRTPAQFRALRFLVASLRTTFGPLDVVGHRDLAATQCPGFDVRGETWPRGLSDLAKDI